MLACCRLGVDGDTAGGHSAWFSCFSAPLGRVGDIRSVLVWSSRLVMEVRGN